MLMAGGESNHDTVSNIREGTIFSPINSYLAIEPSFKYKRRQYVSRRVFPYSTKYKLRI